MLGGDLALNHTQPNITPLNQTPSNKQDNNVVTVLLQHTLDLMKHRSIGPCSIFNTPHDLFHEKKVSFLEAVFLYLSTQIKMGQHIKNHQSKISIFMYSISYHPTLKFIKTNTNILYRYIQSRLQFFICLLPIFAGNIKFFHFSLSVHPAVTAQNSPLLWPTIKCVQSYGHITAGGS